MKYIGEKPLCYTTELSERGLRWAKSGIELKIEFYFKVTASRAQFTVQDYNGSR